MDCIGGADVAAEDADVGRASAARNFLAGDDVDQLLLAAGGVASRDDHRLDVGTGGCSQDRCHCGRLAVLGSYHTVAWLHDVPEDADALDDLRSALTHERLIGSDVGLALCDVNQQSIDRKSTRLNSS